MKLAVLYAGQGAQHPGMGKEFLRSISRLPGGLLTAQRWILILHRVCFEDPDGVLN